MQKIFPFLLLVLAASTAFSQKYRVEKSRVSFFSDAAVEDISAYNEKASGIFNAANGEIVFSIPINEFQFEKSLMQEHFNEKYMDSDKFPKALFQGTVSGYDSKQTGSQQARAAGKLTIHGVTRDIDVNGTLEKQKDKFVMKAKFPVKLADYQIEIPQLLWQNIAEEVEVTVDFTFKAQ
jgi:polyisoprenoid-binding protein YceI